MKNRRVLVTGSAGFIGFHLSKLLLSEGFKVHGFDGITDYYDTNLKNHRNEILCESPDFSFTKGMLEDHALLRNEFKTFKPSVVVHLAAQAGVRYSLKNPKAYIDSNIVGTFNVIEEAKNHNINHLLIASTSSVYGANENMPFKEIDKADTQMTIYAATKKANESMAHSYSHLHKLPTTLFRFFTVYGPWGRPDMALFKFTKGILSNEPIDIYNNGEMYRDFTYVEDIVQSIRLLIDKIPVEGKPVEKNDSLSPVAPYRLLNIGNSKKIRLLDFIEAIENELGKKAVRNLMPMQMGDVSETFADTSLLKALVDYSQNTEIEKGVALFIKWYKDYYNV